MGQLKIATRERNPLLGRTWVWLEQMRKRNAGTEAGPISPVEIEEGRSRIVVERSCTPLHDVFADPTAVEKLAFQRQEGQLVEGIHQAERTTEFEAVDNHRRIGEAYMLRPQITVALDDNALLDPVLEHHSLLDAAPYARHDVGDLGPV